MPLSHANLVGREDEIALLGGILDAVDPQQPSSASRSRAVLLAGDAGVGKTRLLVELGMRASDRGWRVVTGHCLDFGDSALPYLPFSEVLASLEESHPGVVEEVQAIWPVLNRLRPGRRALDGDGASGTSSPIDRSGLFDAVHALIEAVARDQRLVLVVEDLHWADRSTRDLTSFLLSRGFAGPVLLVASYRSDDLHRRHPMRRQVLEWSRLRDLERVTLGPLPADAVRLLASALTPHGLSEADVDAIVTRAEGNAFFVEELANAASASAGGLPEELADLLLMRLDSLDEAAHQVVRAASAAGRKVSHQMLAAIVGLAPDALEQALRDAVESNVLVADAGDYWFRHALLGEAIYDDLLPGERVRLHATCVTVLADGTVSGTSAALARHAKLAHNPEVGLRASIRAGHDALAVGGPDEAATHFTGALELLASLPEPPEDVDPSKVAMAAADALVATGDIERASALLIDHVDRLPETAPDRQRARLHAGLAHVLGLTDVPARDPLEVSELAMSLVPENASGLRARVLSTHAKTLLMTGRHDEAEAPALESLALAERFDLHELASEAMTTLGSLKKNGPRSSFIDALTDAIARAEESGAVAAELRGRFLRARSMQDSGDLDAAAEGFRVAMERAAEAGQGWAPYGFESRWQLALVRLVKGEWEEALRLTSVSGGPMVQRGILATVIATIRQARGQEIEAAEATMRAVWELDGAIPVWGTEPLMRRAAGRRDAQQLRALHDDAVQLLSRLWVPAFGARVRLAAVATGLLGDLVPQTPSAEWPALLAWVEEISVGVDRALERFVGRGDWGPEGAAWAYMFTAERARLAWLTGTGSTAPSDLLVPWQRALSGFEEYGHVREVARVRGVLAQVLRAQGETAAAVAEEALVAETLAALGIPTPGVVGAPGAAARGSQKGTAPAGSSTAPQTPALTARETEILALVAEGLSNGEIGRRLFISTKTVSVHVSRILAKLGAAGRTEAAAIALREGLVPGV